MELAGKIVPGYSVCLIREQQHSRVSQDSGHAENEQSRAQNVRIDRDTSADNEGISHHLAQDVGINMRMTCPGFMNGPHISF